MRTVEGEEVSDKQMAVLQGGETATFGARPKYATVGAGSHWTLPLLLLSDRRLMILKDRLFGKPKPDFSVDWSDVRTVQGGLWKGGGPDIQLIVSTSRRDVELIVLPQYAVDVEAAIRNGYLGAR
jgi:hypothetical protein